MPPAVTTAATPHHQPQFNKPKSAVPGYLKSTEAYTEKKAKADSAKVFTGGLSRLVSSRGILKLDATNRKGNYEGEQRTTKTSSDKLHYVVDTGRKWNLQTGYRPGAYAQTTYSDDNILEMLGFSEGSIRAANGSPVPLKCLEGKSVALYFTCANHPRCTSFTPFLLQFYKSINLTESVPLIPGSREPHHRGKCNCSSTSDTDGGNGGFKRIEVISVSCDETKEEFETFWNHQRRLPWLYVDYDSGVRQDLIRKYNVKPEPALPRHSNFQFRTGVPQLLVIGDDGREVQRLEAEHYAPGHLLEHWDFKNNIISLGASSSA